MSKNFSIEAFANKDLFTLKGEVFEQAVKSGIDLTNAYIAMNASENGILAASGYAVEKMSKEDYSTLNAAHQAALFAYVYGVDKFEFSAENLRRFRSPSRMNTSERDRYYEVISAVETVVTPAVASDFTGKWAEIRNIAWGDTAEFTIDSNEILIAKKSAEGVVAGTNQRVFRDTITINPEPLNIRFDTDWYEIAAGKADFGKMYFRASQGFVNYITLSAYNELVSLATQIPASYRYVGLTTNNIDLATMAVSGANNGQRATILGTLPAVRKVLPTNDFLKFGISEEWVKMGYVGTHAGTPVVKIDNLINPTTINSNTTAGTPSFLFKNDVLFVLPFVDRKPVKIVFEGDLFNAYKNAIQTGDKTESASLTYRIGIKYVYDQIIGVVSENAL